MNQKQALALAEGSFRHVVFTLCAYECVAIASKRVPTLSRLSYRHKWLGPVLVAGLTGHLYRYSRKLEAQLVEIATSNIHVGNEVL